jgi:hypothetical protein
MMPTNLLTTIPTLFAENWEKPYSDEVSIAIIEAPDNLCLYRPRIFFRRLK